MFFTHYYINRYSISELKSWWTLVSSENPGYNESLGIGQFDIHPCGESPLYINFQKLVLSDEISFVTSLTRHFVKNILRILEKKCENAIRS